MHSVNRIYLFFCGLFVLVATPIHAGKLETGFEALKEYDYFKARKIFYAVQRNKPDPQVMVWPSFSAGTIIRSTITTAPVST
jgi:hypothetical protein